MGDMCHFWADKAPDQNKVPQNTVTGHTVALNMQALHGMEPMMPVTGLVAQPATFDLSSSIRSIHTAHGSQTSGP